MVDPKNQFYRATIKRAIAAGDLTVTNDCLRALGKGAKDLGRGLLLQAAKVNGVEFHGKTPGSKKILARLGKVIYG